MRKNNKLLAKPEVEEKLNKAVSVADRIRAEKPSINSIQELLHTQEIRAVMEDILEASSMSHPQREYIRAVFIDRLPKRKALSKAFGKDMGYQEEALAGGIMESNAVKDFVDLVKMFYVRVAPIAALKEVEIMMNPNTDAEIALKAAKQIKEGAGIGVDSRGKAELPVKIVINLPPPQQTNIQINNGKDTTNKK